MHFTSIAVGFIGTKYIQFLEFQNVIMFKIWLLNCSSDTVRKQRFLRAKKIWIHGSENPVYFLHGCVWHKDITSKTTVGVNYDCRFLLNQTTSYSEKERTVGGNAAFWSTLMSWFEAPKEFLTILVKTLNIYRSFLSY